MADFTDDEQDLENFENNDNQEYLYNEDEDDNEDDNEDYNDNFINSNSDVNINPINNIDTNSDDDIKKAIKASLLDYKNDEEQILNLVITESLTTIEDDLKRKLKNQTEDDEILSKVIEESYTSNVVAQFNSGLLISGSLNEFDEDEPEYMRVVLQQIKENEEFEKQNIKNKQTRSIIEDQDFEYEEALRQDIAKEKEKKNAIQSKIPKNISKPETIINKINIINIINTNNSNTSIDSDNNIYDFEKLKTLEDVRKARLTFFNKK